MGGGLIGVSNHDIGKTFLRTEVSRGGFASKDVAGKAMGRTSKGVTVAIWVVAARKPAFTSKSIGKRYVLRCEEE